MATGTGTGTGTVCTNITSSHRISLYMPADAEFATQLNAVLLAMQAMHPASQQHFEAVRNMLRRDTLALNQLDDDGGNDDDDGDGRRTPRPSTPFPLPTPTTPGLNGNGLASTTCPTQLPQTVTQTVYASITANPLTTPPPPATQTIIVTQTITTTATVRGTAPETPIIALPLPTSTGTLSYWNPNTNTTVQYTPAADIKPSSSPRRPDKDDKSPGQNAIAFVAVIGGLAGLAVIAMVGMFLYNRHKKRQARMEEVRNVFPSEKQQTQQPPGPQTRGGFWI